MKLVFIKLQPLVALCVALLFGQIVYALEFQSINKTGTIMYGAPSDTAKKLFVVGRHYPVEILSRQNQWARVRDATGGIAWVSSQNLTSERWLLVTSDRADVHGHADTGSAILFSMPKDGVLALMDGPEQGWVKVRHPDGEAGYALITDFWGL